jgi:hypothetical protein
MSELCADRRGCVVVDAAVHRGRDARVGVSEQAGYLVQGERLEREAGFAATSSTTKLAL